MTTPASVVSEKQYPQLIAFFPVFGNSSSIFTEVVGMIHQVLIPTQTLNIHG